MFVSKVNIFVFIPVVMKIELKLIDFLYQTTKNELSSSKSKTFSALIKTVEIEGFSEINQSLDHFVF